MPPKKSRRSPSRRFNHLDALGGIELKAYTGTRQPGGADDPSAAVRSPMLAGTTSASVQPPSC